MRVGIDLDGVGYDFQAGYAEYLRWCGIVGYDHKFPIPKRWAFYEDWGYTLDEFLPHCNDGVNAGIIFGHGHPNPGFKGALHVLRQHGHTIHIITDRSFGDEGMSKSVTEYWLERHGIEYDTITYTADKTSVAVDIMVDDKMENYDALDAFGVEVWLYTRPWNEEHKTARRVKDMWEFVRKVEDADEGQTLPPGKRPATIGETMADVLRPQAQKVPREGIFRVVPDPPVTQEVRVVNAKSGGVKGSKGARFDLIPVGPLTRLAEHFGRGALKYADNNWRRGYDWHLSYAAGSRHWNAFWAGEEFDICPDDGAGCQHVDAEGAPFVSPPSPNGPTCFNHTGSKHITAAVWHGMCLDEFSEGDQYAEFDDRYKGRHAK